MKSYLIDNGNRCNVIPVAIQQSNHVVSLKTLTSDVDELTQTKEKKIAIIINSFSKYSIQIHDSNILPAMYFLKKLPKKERFVLEFHTKNGKNFSHAWGLAIRDANSVISNIFLEIHFLFYFLENTRYAHVQRYSDNYVNDEIQGTRQQTFKP